MPRRISRRALSHYLVSRLASSATRQQAVLQVAAYLVQSHRVKELDVLLRDVDQALLASGQANATVVTAHELSSELRHTIEQLVAQQTGAHSIQLDAQIDSTVIGGFRLLLPGRRLDNTIDRALTILRTANRKM